MVHAEGSVRSSAMTHGDKMATDTPPTTEARKEMATKNPTATATGEKAKPSISTPMSRGSSGEEGKELGGMLVLKKTEDGLFDMPEQQPREGSVKEPKKKRLRKVKEVTEKETREEEVGKEKGTMEEEVAIVIDAKGSSNDDRRTGGMDKEHGWTKDEEKEKEYGVEWWKLLLYKVDKKHVDNMKRAMLDYPQLEDLMLVQLGNNPTLEEVAHAVGGVPMFGVRLLENEELHEWFETYIVRALQPFPKECNYRILEQEQIQGYRRED